MDGHRVVDAVHTREELYEGPCVHESPELVIELSQREGYTYTLLPSARSQPGQTWREIEPHEYPGGKGLGMNGTHRQHGVLALWGSGVQAGARVEAGMADIAPTLLQAAGLPIPKDMHGKSLLPILEGQCDSREHRPFVRSIYYRVLAGAPSYASMIRTREYKLVQYHGHGLGELFDMKTDPHEFDNLWDDPKLSGVRFDLLTKAFDAAALATDLGPRRVGRY